MPRTSPLPRFLARFVLLQLMLIGTAKAATAVSVSKRDGTYTVNASAEIHATPQTVWEVLTDFEHFTRFVPDMRLSHVLSGSGNAVIVEQKGVADILFFHRLIDAVMAVDMQPQTTIQFHAIRGNLRMMKGSWTIKPTSTGCHIEYASVSVPDFWTPPLIAPLLVRSEVQEQIDGVIAEIDRRTRTLTAPKGPALSGGDSTH